MLSAELSCDLRVASLRKALAKIHCYLPWNQHMASVGTNSQIIHAKFVIVGYSLLDTRDGYRVIVIMFRYVADCFLRQSLGNRYAAERSHCQHPDERPFEFSNVVLTITR